MSHLGIVIVGRNEDDHLGRCLMSMVGRRLSVVYVDSNWTNGGVKLARGTAG